MSLNDTTKLDYINNYFHQYLDITLNRNVLTNSFVNLVVPVEKLFELSKTNFENEDETNKYSHDVVVDDSVNVNDLLKKYDDTSIGKETKCICTRVTRVIDGDTFIAKLPIYYYNNQEKNGKVEFEEKRIRLVGIDTPEINYKKPENTAKGAYESKKMLEKICYSDRYYKEYVVEGNLNAEPNEKEIYLNIDNKRHFDKYNRVLAVLIVDNKNINEVLLKEGVARVMYIPPTEFYPFDWDYSPEEKRKQFEEKKEKGLIPDEYDEEVIDNNPIEDEEEENIMNYSYDDLLKLSVYLNSDMSNVVFTPQNDTTKLYRYEIYKNVLYIRLDPYTTKIRMHILPKGYDCTNQLLFFRDNMIDKRKILQSTPQRYKIYEDIEEINAYFQEDGKDRDRTLAESAQPPYDQTGVETTFCEFDYDIKEANSYENVQICAGYNYNHTSPYYAIHYTGIKDEDKNRAAEDRCSLIDANTDEVKDKTNIISHMIIDNTSTDDIINFPPYNDISVLNDFGSIERYHTNDDNLRETHHKIIKYINHDMYTEEDIDYTSHENDDKHCYAEWEENFE